VIVRSFTSAFILYLLLMLIYLNPLRAAEPVAISAGTAALSYTSYLAHIECKNTPSFFDRCYRVFTTSTLVITITGLLAKKIEDVKPLAYADFAKLQAAGESFKNDYSLESWESELDPRLVSVMDEVEAEFADYNLGFKNKKEVLMWMINF
jgi:hypothetical protein